MYLSWIIPAYNEERRIARTLRDVDQYLRGRHFREGYEIIVVNSASRDRTATIVTELAREISSVRLLNIENRGKGWAVKQGMLAGRGEVRLFSDADNSTRPEYFDAMIPLFTQGYEVVISSRDPRDAVGARREGRREPWYRRLFTVGGNLLIQLVGAWGIWDTQNGFKAFRADAAERIFSQSRIDGFAFDVEALALAKRFGYQIATIPVVWMLDPDSKVTLGGALKVFFDVFRIRWNVLSGKYRLRIFLNCGKIW